MHETKQMLETKLCPHRGDSVQGTGYENILIIFIHTRQ